MAILGGLGTWVGDAIAALRRRLNLDRSTRAANRLERLLQNWPNLLALVVGTVALLRFLGGLYSGGFLNLREPFRWSDLLWSVPLSLLGAVHGILFLALQTWTKRWVAPIRHRPVLRAVLGGFTLGLMALFVPMLQFSGQHQLQQVYEQAAQLGFWALLLIALARIFLVNLLLASGWKGGQFLPIMFSSAALGLSVTVLFPSVPAPAAVLAVMAALLVVVLPKPLIVLGLMAVMFPIQYLGISVVAVVMLMLGRRLWKKAETTIPMRLSDDSPADTYRDRAR